MYNLNICQTESPKSQSCSNKETSNGDNQFIKNSLKCVNCQEIRKYDKYEILAGGSRHFEVSFLSISQPDLLLKVDFGDRKAFTISILKDLTGIRSDLNNITQAFKPNISLSHFNPTSYSESFTSPNHSTDLSTSVFKYSHISSKTSQKCIFTIPFKHLFERDGTYSLTLTLSPLYSTPNTLDVLYLHHIIKITPTYPHMPMEQPGRRKSELPSNINHVLRPLYKFNKFINNNKNTNNKTLNNVYNNMYKIQNFREDIINKNPLNNQQEIIAPINNLKIAMKGTPIPGKTVVLMAEHRASRGVVYVWRFGDGVVVESALKVLEHVYKKLVWWVVVLLCGVMGV